MRLPYDLLKRIPGISWLELGGGYRFSYRTKPNGYGGWRRVSLMLHHEANGVHRIITDGDGRFLRFPGVTEGSWREALKRPLRRRMDFPFSWDTNDDPDRPIRLYWLVQPDGRYFGDEGGFGMEDDEEVVLYADLDKNGRFTGPFRAAEGR